MEKLQPEETQYFYESLKDFLKEKGFLQRKEEDAMKGSVRKKGNSWYYSFDVTEKGEKRKRIEVFGGNTREEAKFALGKTKSLYTN